MNRLYFLAVMCLSSCYTVNVRQTMNRGCDALKGKNLSEAIQVLGEPSSYTDFSASTHVPYSFGIYAWSPGSRPWPSRMASIYDPSNAMITAMTDGRGVINQISWSSSPTSAFGFAHKMNRYLKTNPSAGQ